MHISFSAFAPARALAVVCCALLLTGCGAAQVALTKKDLNVQTISSDTIFLDIENQKGRRVYVDVRNTSDKELYIYDKIVSSLAARGYTSAVNARQADYILQVNILAVAMADPSAMETSVRSGYGTGLGAVAGALIGMGTNSARGVVTGAGVGGLVGAGVGFLADALVKDVTYGIITDVMVSEKTSFRVRESQIGVHSTGKGTARVQQVNRQSSRQRYQTRIASYANKVNLKFEEAQGPLEDGLARAIAGIF